MTGNRRLQRKLTATRRDLAQQRVLASRDSLTGLANRPAIEAELSRRLGGDAAFALFLLDLDGFKPVNDAYGHPAGDIVLAEVAHRLVNGPADLDVVGRLGGDEFVVISDAPMWMAQHAQGPAIRAAIARPISVDGGVWVTVSASVGLLQVRPGDELGDVLRSVDAALYRAKAAGGDVVVDFGSGPLLTADENRPGLRLRDAHPNRVPDEQALLLVRAGR
ncbi:GGDEF domain-containing protein [Actinoplanes subglobosus]|uniref:GGDEF domain-containing protein n=1 Tax=Actinoplanes subglobosus TaxID=1547892 RepID=A0ABV8IU15_9ACTN